MAENRRHRSEEIQEIMGVMPSWLTRWGITVTGIVILILFLCSYFMKYPDVITAKCNIHYEQHTAIIIAGIQASDIVKIRAMQKAQIRLTTPSQIIIIPAAVSSIPDKVMPASFEVYLEPTNDSIINRNSTLFTKGNIEGTAEIFTSDKSILSRLFQNIFK